VIASYVFIYIYIYIYSCGCILASSFCRAFLHCALLCTRAHCLLASFLCMGALLRSAVVGTGAFVSHPRQAKDVVAVVELEPQHGPHPLQWRLTAALAAGNVTSVARQVRRDRKACIRCRVG
jgi:hypothetical protein